MKRTTTVPILVTAASLLATAVATSAFAAKSIWTELPTIAAVVGLAACAAGIGGLTIVRMVWLSRGRTGRWRTLMLFAGWGGVALSLILFTRLNGIARGISIGACVLTMIAYAFVLLGTDVRKARQRTRQAAVTQANPHGRRGFPWRAVGRFLAVFFLPMTAALSVSLTQTAYGPGSNADRLVIASCLLPLWWAVAMIWILFEERVWRPAIGLTLITAIAIGTTYLAPIQA